MFTLLNKSHVKNKHDFYLNICNKLVICVEFVAQFINEPSSGWAVSLEPTSADSPNQNAKETERRLNGSDK